MFDSKGYCEWFDKTYRIGGGRKPSMTAWHFFDYMTRFKRAKAFCLPKIERVPATELMRMFRQDCFKKKVRATWKNAVRWYDYGAEGLQ